MTIMRWIQDSFLTTHGEPRLVVAQAEALSRRLPVLHSILILNVVAVAYIHYDLAPLVLTVFIPACIISVSVIRIMILIHGYGTTIDANEAAARLRNTNLVAAALGGGCALWSVRLSSADNAATQMYAFFFITMTMTACIFCLMHLRSSAKILGSIAFPFIIYYIWTGSSLVAIAAFNFAAIVGLMIHVQSSFYQDFRDLSRLNDQNALVANRDSLTELPNRRFFFVNLETKIAEATGKNQRFTLGLIDLDGFKAVNDTFGHQTGDSVLWQVGQRLLDIPDLACVARLGGDEFGVLVSGSADVSDIGNLICERLRTPYDVNGVTARIGATIGFSTFPEGGAESEQLIEGADFALYFAKTNTPGKPVIYSCEHQSALRRHGMIEQALRYADLKSELSLAYQPIVDVKHQRVLAFEALARWDSPTLGRVSPTDFIPIAERAGLVQQITLTLLPQAIEALKHWPGDVQLSFNLSTHDISSPQAAAQLLQVIEESGAAPSRIIFEVTETALMRDFAACAHSLAALRASGAAIALDDFGTGYSSLAYVQRLPLDRLKIDRVFTADIGHDRMGRAIVKSVIDLCRSMNIGCVVEGVETEEQSAVLQAQGCSVMQGYLFHKPMTLTETQVYLREARHHNASLLFEPMLKFA